MLPQVGERADKDISPVQAGERVVTRGHATVLFSEIQ